MEKTRLRGRQGGRGQIEEINGDEGWGSGCASCSRPAVCAPSIPDRG